MDRTLAKFLVSASDQPGLVARFAGFFFDLGLNIVDAGNHTGTHPDGAPLFFMRLVVDLAGLSGGSAHAKLGGSATRRSSTWPRASASRSTRCR